MELNDAIANADSAIRNAEAKRQGAVKAIKERAEQGFSGGFFEGFLSKKELASELDCRIAGIDSGFAAKELFSIDIILIRAVGACFEYKKGIVEKTFYYPGIYSFPEPFVSTELFERDEFNSLVSIKRLLKEIEATQKTMELYSPEYCFIDGSIVPQHHDKPRSQNAKAHYREMIGAFHELYETAEKKSCTLIASVEDSRGNRWAQIMKEALGEKGKELGGMKDTFLLDALLGKGERTASFSYAEKPEEHPILQDFSEKWRKETKAFYIKPSLFDFPLRIEFHAGESETQEKAVEIAGIVLAQASCHKEYAYPSVLIEADLRAGLKPEEISIVCDKIMDKAGKNHFTQRRRDRRPF